MLNRLKLIGLPCLLLLCCTLPHLNQGDFRRDTVRYAAVGLQMWTEGPPGVMRLNPETPYFNKPPLAIAIHGLFLKLFGVHLAVARVPSILAALGVVILSVLTVRLIASRAEAVVSGLVLATTYEFFRRTREISLDFWQLFFVMLAVYVVVKALKQNRPGGLALALAGVPLGLALLCKPLVALAVLPILAGWAWLAGRRQAAVWLLTATLAVALLVALPWHLYMWSLYGPAFAQQYFGHEVLSRAQGNLKSNPFHYYFANLLKTYWPWLLAVAWAVRQRWFRLGQPQRRRFRDLTWLGGFWVACVLLMLSFFPDKKVNYPLPVYPMLSWVAAAGLCRVPWQKLRDWYARGFAGLAPATASLLVLLSVLPLRVAEPPSENWQALFDWLRAEHIPPASLRHHEVKPELLCYYYLQTGVFPQRFEPGASESAVTNRLILIEPEGDSARAAAAPVLFAAGKLAIVSSTNWVAPMRQ